MTISEFIDILNEYREQYGEVTIVHDYDNGSSEELYEESIYVNSKGLHI